MEITDLQATARISIRVPLHRFRGSLLYVAWTVDQDYVIDQRPDEDSESTARVEWAATEKRSLQVWMREVGGPMLALGASDIQIDVSSPAVGINASLSHAYHVTRAMVSYDDEKLSGAHGETLAKIRAIVNAGRDDSEDHA